jgi:hypothetical protein
MKPEPRPMSALAWAILHRIADDDRDDLERLVAYVSDPQDVDHGERRQFLRCAERDAWTAVELLLLRAMIQRRLRDGRLDGWVRTTPLGEEIRDMLAEFFDSHRTVEFPEEPKNFGVIAFQELCAARIAGALHAGLRDVAATAGEIMARFAVRLTDRFPLFAEAIRNPALDLPGMGWGILDWRIRCNFETLVALPTERTPPPNPGLEDLTVLLINVPSAVTEFIGDVYAEAEFARRIKLAGARNMRRGIAEAAGGTVADVPPSLDRVIPIRATTLAEAVAAAEQVKKTDNTIVAINALWGWYTALPLDQRKALGDFRSKHDLWITARFRHRLR